MLFISFREALHSLQRQLRLVDVELGRKCLSVTLEQKVQSIRKALKDRQPMPTLTETNMTITGSLRQHPVQILK